MLSLAGTTIVLEWTKKHPDKFVPSYAPTVPPPDAESLSRSLDSAINQGFKGVGELLLPLFGMSLNDERRVPLYAKAEQLGIVSSSIQGQTTLPKESWISRVQDTCGKSSSAWGGYDTVSCIEGCFV
ncbi:MAG: hypothetical protein AOA65_0122 [Candidatus Bathyarchaeota archaeon BA1]|nr:MAG: hypothetical protein AOA65_0122 [Candidatus Bathyarchaeota archaeon BA1]